MNDFEYLSADERALWQAYVRDIVPYKKETDIPSPAVSINLPLPSFERKNVRFHAKDRPIEPVKKTKSTLVPAKLLLLPKKTQRTIHFTARCDLHGHSIDAAFHVTLQFLMHAFKEKHKIVLLITGKGTNSKEAQETLHTLLPRWLKEIPCLYYVRGFAQASLKHGGNGAFYLFLRK
ncbi:MAG: Smr/MutS family protein [Holosporales bacterium]|nr:Smr/MutS family protein [Holosporales bacterium]